MKTLKASGAVSSAGGRLAETPRTRGWGNISIKSEVGQTIVSCRLSSRWRQATDDGDRSSVPLSRRHKVSHGLSAVTCAAAKSRTLRETMVRL
jgi:hypothetical protein